MRAVEAFYLSCIAASAACWMACGNHHASRERRNALAQGGAVVTVIAMLALLCILARTRSLRWQLVPSVLPLALMAYPGAPVVQGLFTVHVDTKFATPATILEPSIFDELMADVTSLPVERRMDWSKQLPLSAAREVIFRDGALWDERLDGQLKKVIKAETYVIKYHAPSGLTIIVTLVCLMICGLLCHEFPLPKFGRLVPGAKFEDIGFVRHELTISDEDFKDKTVVARDSDQFSVLVFYPAANKGTMPYALTAVLESLASAAKLPVFVLSHLKQLQIDSAPGAPLHPAATACPAIVFSHGLMAMPGVYWALISTFVRAGYIVVCPEHNDGSAAFIFLEDGTEDSYDTETDIVGGAVDEFPENQLILQDHRRKQLRRRVAEAHACMEWLVDIAGPKAEKSQRFAGSIDMSRLGYVGHSFGGATALAASDLDEDARACVCYDCWAEEWGPALLQRRGRQGMRRCPTFFAMSAAWEGNESDRHIRDTLLKPWEQKGHPGNEHWIVPGTLHAQPCSTLFSDPRSSLTRAQVPSITISQILCCSHPTFSRSWAKVARRAGRKPWPKLRRNR